MCVCARGQTGTRTERCATIVREHSSRMPHSARTVKMDIGNVLVLVLVALMIYAVPRARIWTSAARSRVSTLYVCMRARAFSVLIIPSNLQLALSATAMATAIVRYGGHTK